MSDLTIFVLPRGWVVVGVPAMTDDMLGLTLTHCGTVRSWGTTKGLGELAANGPTPNTIIDQEPDGSAVNRLHVYRTLKCNATAPAWKKFLRAAP